MMRERVVETALMAAGVAMMASGIASHARALRANDRAQEPRAVRESRAATPPVFAVVGARIFDGIAVVERATVLVENGVIRAVGPGVAVPDGTAIVDGAGKTLLPGLIDAHTHVVRRRACPGARVRRHHRARHVHRPELRGIDARRTGPRRRQHPCRLLLGRNAGHGTGRPRHRVRRRRSRRSAAPTRRRPSWMRASPKGPTIIKIIYDDGASLGLRVPVARSEDGGRADCRRPPPREDGRRPRGHRAGRARGARRWRRRPGARVRRCTRGRRVRPVWPARGARS